METRARDERERLAELAQLVLRAPNSIPHRLDLAMALLNVGRRDEAIGLFRDIALAYADAGQLVQAMAVCRGILEIDPDHQETLALLSALVERRGGRPARVLDEYDEDTTVDELEGAAPAETPALEAAPAPSVPIEADGDTDDEPEEPTSPGAGPVGISAPEGVQAEVSGEQDAVVAALGVSARLGQSISEMPVFPLLSDLPRAAFVDLLRKLRIVERGPNEVLLAEGGQGDAFYLIAEGSVRVKKGTTELALLGPGSFFGEFAVLSDQRRHATVESVTAVRLLEIDRALLDRLIADHPGVARILRAFYGDRLLSTLLQTAPFFAVLQPEERADVAARFRPRRFGRGATIVAQGSAGGGLYLILVGEVEVVRCDAAGDVELARLGEGSYFGEMSLLKGSNASATVRATRLCETVQLPPRDFYEIVSRHPVLWEQLRDEVQRRELTNVAILAGEARGDEAGSIYLV